MLDQRRLQDFIRREIFYVIVIVFDVFALGAFWASAGPAAADAGPVVPQQLRELGRILNKDYLDWAQRASPKLMGALAFLMAGVLVAGIAGVALLAWSAARTARGRAVLAQRVLLETRWNLWDVVKIAAVYPFLVVLGFSMVSAALPLRDLPRDEVLLISIGVNYLAMAGTLFFIWHVVRTVRGQSLRALGYGMAGGADVRRALACYAALLPIFLAASQITEVIARQFGGKTQLQEIVPVFVAERSMAVTGAIVLLACLVAPIVEETFFRGYLQPAVRKLVGPSLAIVVTALAFAAAHRSLSVFLPIFALGLVLGYLYEKTQSTFASAVLHSIHNTVTTCFLLLIKHMPVREYGYPIV